MKDIAVIGMLLLRNEKPYSYCTFTQNEDGTVRFEKNQTERKRYEQQKSN